MKRSKNGLLCGILFLLMIPFPIFSRTRFLRFTQRKKNKNLLKPTAQHDINCHAPWTNLKIAGNLLMNDSFDSGHGNILKGKKTFIHNFGKDNTFVGKKAGNFQNTGTGNSGFGKGALGKNKEGNRNTAVGVNTLSTSFISDDNTAIGYHALKSKNVFSSISRGGGFGCPGATINTAVGAFALENNETGCGNTAIGAEAGKNNRNGAGNAFVGFEAGLNTIDGSTNTAIGTEALINNINGSNNCVLGFSALPNLANGNHNIAIGGTTGFLLQEGSNNIYIGREIFAEQSEDGVIRVGNSVHNASAYVAGIFEAEVGPNNALVYVDEDGKLGTIPLVRRSKQSFEEINKKTRTSIVEKLLQLSILSSLYSDDRSKSLEAHFSLCPEEVAQCFPSLVIYDKNNTPISVRYDLLSLLYLTAIQELHAQMETRISKLESQISSS